VFVFSQVASLLAALITFEAWNLDISVIFMWPRTQLKIQPPTFTRIREAIG